MKMLRCIIIRGGTSKGTRRPRHVSKVLEVDVPAPDSYRQLSTQPGRT